MVAAAANTMELLKEQVGHALDYNIYLDGQAVVLRGQVLTEQLFDRISKLDPARIHSSKVIEAADTSNRLPEHAIENTLRDEGTEIIKSAGIVEALSEEVRQVATKKVREVFESCRYLTKIDLAAAEETVAELVKRSSGLSDCAFKLDELKQLDDYTFMHSVNVCTLGISVFRELIDNDAQLTQIGLGLLLHDIGKSKIDLRLLHKPGSLSPEEDAVMRKHVVFGHNLLKNSNDLSPEAKNIILNHHERVNGTGYTRGLKESELGVFDMAAAICDVFDAVTTNRAYRQAIDVHRAVSIIIQGSSTLFSARLVNHFLQQIGRFPVGTFVQLSSGEVGVVSSINRSAQARPTIKLVFDAFGTRLPTPQTLDLYEQQGVYILRPIDKHPYEPVHVHLAALSYAF